MTRTYRRAHLVDKPTVYGWHSFALHTTTARCMGCHGIVPVEALADGSWRWRIGGRCREFLRAIPQHAAGRIQA